MAARRSRPDPGPAPKAGRPGAGIAEAGVTAATNVAGPASDGASPLARPGRIPLPADDPSLFDLDLRGLRERWAEANARPPMSAEAMTGADRRAQLSGMTGERLMEHAGTAVAAATHALALATDRPPAAPILILCGPGNNGGDGLVAARHLARAGHPVVVVLVAADPRPATPDAERNWDRLDAIRGVTRIHTPVARDVAILAQGIDRVGVVVDALLGTGTRGALREPIRTAVETIQRAREAAVPVVAVDTPTAVDLSSGDPSDPVVRADLTVTFHRPKSGLRTRIGAALAGRVLVAPIGIPKEADPT